MREIHLAETGAGGTGGAQRGPAHRRESRGVLCAAGDGRAARVPARAGTAGGLGRPLFKAILRKLDFSREQFDKDLETYSEGQKKKVLLAKSLCQPAHLYVWDEPLNFIDVLSRVQIEDLLLASRPTLLFVEHDRAFGSGSPRKRSSYKSAALRGAFPGK